MTRRAGWWAAATCAVLATAPALEASAFCRMTTESGTQVEGAACSEGGIPLEWKPACISYAIDARGSQSAMMSDEEMRRAIDDAFLEWANVDCGGSNPPSVVFQPLQESTCRRAEFNCAGNVNTIAFLDPWREPCATSDLPDAAFALTRVLFRPSNGEILDADMLINDELARPRTGGGPYANCPDTGCPPSVSGPGVADLQSIVTHEVGHLLGIGHSEVLEATMFATTNRRSVNKRTLHPDDEDAICSIYPPGSLDQSCNATPFGGLELNCEEKACTTETCRVTTGGRGCSAAGNFTNAPVGSITAALLALIALRRRSRLARGS